MIVPALLCLHTPAKTLLVAEKGECWEGGAAGRFHSIPIIRRKPRLWPKKGDAGKVELREGFAASP